MNANIQHEKVLDGIIQWIKDWFASCGGSKAIVGISGGKDSTVVAALCAKALGKENVYGVMMPNGTQSDIEDSKRLCQFLGINTLTVNINQAYNGLLSEMPETLEITPNFKTNTPSRLRMVTLYGIAACIPGSRVANTGNYDEAYCGYTTIYGDFAGDFACLKNLHVSEVVAIGDLLGLPKDLVHKAPSDGMCGKTDEDNLGFTYAQVEQYSRAVAEGKTGGDCKIDETSIPNAEKIAKKHAQNSFKQELIKLPCPIKYIQDFLTARE